VGIVGTGVMGADHARLLGTVVAGAELTAVSDVDSGRAVAVARALPGVRALPDPLALIKDDAVDAVVVASSDATHEEFVLAALAVGKPVLCEKPLAPTVEACRRILDAEASAGGGLVSVGFMRRHDPGFLAVKAALDGGQIGTPLLMHCVHRNVSYPPDVPSATLITGSAVHEMDIARWLLGDEIVAVTVHRPRSSRAAGRVTDPLFLVLETAAGVVVDVEVFVNARYGYEVRCELVGEDGTVSLDAPAPTVVRRSASAGRTLPADWRPRFAEAYRRELQDWVDALRTGRVSRLATAWDGYVATVVAAAGVVSLGSGSREPVVSLPPRS
jgi:myo-inositol 2-dehydrogenase/D-chiro-inositol 1-dehydrogenase